MKEILIYTIQMAKVIFVDMPGIFTTEILSGLGVLIESKKHLITIATGLSALCGIGLGIIKRKMNDSFKEL